jgi:hypothetical protein
MSETGTDRAVSEVLGYSLIFSIILVSVGIVSVSGVGALQDARDAEQVKNAEQAFDVLHDNMEDIYLEGAPSRATEISLGESSLDLGDNVTIEIGRYDGSDWTNTSYQTRPLVQRLSDDRRLVYVAGAIFRTNRQSSVVVDGPPVFTRGSGLHYTLPALQSASVRSLGGGTVLFRGEVSDRTVLASDSGGNTYTKFAITVTSPRADLWNQYLEDQGFDCSVTGDTAECAIDDSSFSSLYVTVHEIDATLIP